MKRRAPTASSCSAITPGKKKFAAAANGAAPDPSTPPPPLQQSTSPEMPLASGSKRRRLKMGVARKKSTDSIASSASGGSIRSSGAEIVYGSPVLGLASGRFLDRRKTRPTAILTVDGDGSDGSDGLSWALRPAMASVHWLENRGFKPDKENESSFEFPLAGKGSTGQSDKDSFDDAEQQQQIDKDFSTNKNADKCGISTNSGAGYSIQPPALENATNRDARK